MKRYAPEDCCEPSNAPNDFTSHVCANCRHWDREHPVYLLDKNGKEEALPHCRCKIMERFDLGLDLHDSWQQLRSEYHTVILQGMFSRCPADGFDDLWEPDETYLDAHDEWQKEREDIEETNRSLDRWLRAQI